MEVVRLEMAAALILAAVAVLVPVHITCQVILTSALSLLLLMLTFSSGVAMEAIVAQLALVTVGPIVPVV